ncbi:hypothetical protein KSP39_PZI019746 [Platanthera zijinensis]|uniref:Uncharacterized protein n=1 Tax=Platanthera zijinensis TaxID=2320716 RepID=A0AAP0FXQ1_9ASPA
MDDEALTKEFLQSRIEHLEHERDELRKDKEELRKDIEQLCIQQAGPSYLALATRMHFQRMAGLEQEIETLKKRLAGLLREKQNLQEELSEAYRIKAQLADLHNAEVLKNKEAEMQLKFFQGCVAAAFSERDHSLMEFEKAKDRDEAILEKLNISKQRIEELESAYYSEKEGHIALVNELGELKEQTESFEKVINKFYAIRERDTGLSAGHTLQSRCSCLLDDPLDKWMFNSDSKSTTSVYIASLEEEIESRKQAMEKLQNNMRMGLQIEKHLKRSVWSLEKKQMQFIETFGSGISSLRHIYNQHRVDVVEILEEEKSHWKKVLLEVDETLLQVHLKREPKRASFQEEHLSDSNPCKDLHVTDDVDFSHPTEGVNILSSDLSSRMGNTSVFLSQALQEKVAALLLLSQQEERHLLERETNSALYQKMEELQRNFSQVTHEKIEALMELAQLKREYHVLQDRHAMKYDRLPTGSFDKSITSQEGEREGTLTNILKKTSLKRWIGKNCGANDTNVKVINESNVTSNENYQLDFARLKVEYAALQESILNMEHLTSSIHRLHVSLLKVADDAAFNPSETTKSLGAIITKANQARTALGSSLPVSWFSDPTVNVVTYESLYEPDGLSSERRSDRTVKAAGFEMVELLILAAEFFKEKTVMNADTCS